MAEVAPRTLNHFALYSFADAYWLMNDHAKASFHEHWLAGLGIVATNFDVYQTTDARTDLLVWCVLNAEEECALSDFHERLSAVTTPYRHLMRPVDSLWGFTRPAASPNGATTQTIDPLSTTRANYLALQPHSRTSEWYGLDEPARARIEEEEARIAGRYEGVRELQLHSLGLQDQESVVAREADDVRVISELAAELRRTEARRYIRQDTPIYTGIYHPAAQTLALSK